MSRVLGSWIEVTIPTARMLEPDVAAALDESIKVVGGATVTAAEGFYIREDTGALDREYVSVVRWDFDIGNGYSGMNSAAIGAAHAVVQALLSCGEESVLRRRYYADWHGRGEVYKSELIFA